MEKVEQIRERIRAALPRAEITVVPNPSPSGQHSLLLDAAHAFVIAQWLRDDSALRLDQCTNVTGVDWPDQDIVETARISNPDLAGGAPRLMESKTTRRQPGCFEVVYHLYSVALKHGPVILRVRTANRTDNVSIPSLTPLWRSCEFQEREVFDLFGVHFTGHPDLRRLLMWDSFRDHPMRKDYVEPSDYDWEPTAHGSVLAKARAHAAPTVSAQETTRP
jgi:NADH-quinone oxidoreductase subunit C